MKVYSDEDMLMLSGIQHIAFCERQWALIHIEQQWQDNVLTVEGQHLHERSDDPFQDNVKGNVIMWRSIAVISYSLGLYGHADVVELEPANNDDKNSILIKNKSGRWKLSPVEFKRGKPKPDERDEVQLCAQALCLEEMYGINIFNGFLYYGTTRHRNEVQFDSKLRELVKFYANRMHEIFMTALTPPADYQPHCRSCSLKDICLPGSMENRVSASDYLKTNLMDITAY